MATFFDEPSRQWNRTNLRFDHEFGGCATNRIVAELPMHNYGQSVPGKFDVPAEQTLDFTDWAYGEMPHTMTARPLLYLPGCCDCNTIREFDIARDMFGPANGKVTLTYPCWEPAFIMGCQDAQVQFAAPNATAITGVYGYNCCTGCFSTEETLKWTSLPSEPYMKWRRLSAWDQFKYEFCCDIWVGWRGDFKRNVEASETEEWYSYDNSYVLNVCDQCKLTCAKCSRMNNECCADHNDAPRPLRSEEIRRLVLTRYDWEFSRRNIKGAIAGNESLTDYNLRENKTFVAYPLPYAHEVDALYTARLYHTVKCTAPRVRYANDAGIAGYGMAGCDVRYRGSEVHNKPTLEDHLIVLAGLIVNAANTFPFVKAGEYGQCGLGWAANIGPSGNVSRGRLVPSDAPLPQ